MKNKMKVVAGSVAMIALSASLTVGGTLALFTSESNVDVAVTAGKVAISATVSGLETYSYDQPTVNQNGKWSNGGEATVVENVVTLSRITPGDSVKLDIDVASGSDVTVQYRLIIEATKDTGLLSGLNISVDFKDGLDEYDVENFIGFAATKWMTLSSTTTDVAKAKLTIALPEEAGNEYQGKEASLSYRVEAIQGNAKMRDMFENNEIKNADDFRYFAALLSSSTKTFEGETISLTTDVATAQNLTMRGANFNGNGKTIDGFAITERANCAITTTGGTVENVTILGAPRGVGSGSSGTYKLSKDLVINNVYVDEGTYAINVGGGNGNKMTVTDSTLYGWTSYSGLSAAEFDGCTFGQGQTDYAHLRAYDDTTFTACKFEQGFTIDADATGFENGAGLTVTLSDCYYGNTLITAQNFAQLLTEQESNKYTDALKQCTVIVNGVVVVW